MKRMVIKGSVWHRGGPENMGGELSALLTDNGRRCCLGIHGVMCGVSDERMFDVSEPDEVEFDLDHINECYEAWTDAPELANDAMQINDSSHTTDDRKIAELRPIFMGIGVTIVWRPDL